jgi:hypothetical protein
MSQCMVGETNLRRAFIARKCRSDRADFRDKWRSTANSRGRRRLDAAGFHGRKIWMAGGLRSGTVGFGHGEMALETLEKAPFGAIFQHFLDDFLRGFPQRISSRRDLARIWRRKAGI